MTASFTKNIAYLFIALSLSAVATANSPGDKTHAGKRRVYSADRQEGVIGVTAANPTDNPADNLFHVYLKVPLKGNQRIWLSYDLDGVQDYTAVSRSINDQLAVGGYFVRKRSGWEHQRQRVSATWLREGDNVIRFTLPAGATYGYKVRNLSIEVGAPAEEESVVVTQQSAPAYDGKGYIEGFITGAGRKQAKVTIDGRAARVWKGTFEAIVGRPADSAAGWQSTVVVEYPDGRKQRRLVRFTGEQRADYQFGLSDAVQSEQRWVRTGQAAVLSTGNASIAIPQGALRAASTVSITALRTIDLPAMDMGMVNVTPAGGGFRFLPHGTRFAQDAKLTLSYDSAAIPDGYTEKDIRTYYFDEKKGHWIALPLDSVSAGSRKIISRTGHFTDMINAIIKAPESPQVEAYNSNSMKGIKAADPGRAVNLIAPPKANPMGGASLGYPIELPAGRHGLQPQVAIGYNSAGGDGWMGMGWDLSTPCIGIDTRWGVPRFDAQNETETYTMSGAQLSPVAHRGNLVARTAEKQFYPRVEAAFDKIIRHGNNPQNYWWEATDKEGTRYFYGGDPSSGADAASTLGDASGNIAHWALREVLDLHGNFIHYFYTKVNDPGIIGSTVMGVQLYLSKITYTGYNGTEGRYSVLFGRDRDVDGHSIRKDVTVTAINGFKQVTADLLRRIDVQLDGVDIRHYELNYKEGAFYKTLLAGISQYDAAGKFFNQHTFNYYNDIASGGTLVPLAGAQSWVMGSDNIHGDMLTHLNGFTDEASSLSGTSNSDLSGGVTVSVGFGSPADKLNSIGGSFSYSQSQSKGLLAMIDINGDGLPDKLFYDGGSDALYYRPNLSGVSGKTSFGNRITINGLNVFQKDRSSGYTVGLEAVALTALMAGANTGQTTNTTTIYFTEANGDQLADIVKDGQVYFNHLDSTTGQITFTPTSVGTPSPVFAGVTISQNLVDPTELANDRQQAIDQNPLQDIVRMWQAPYNGTINVTAPVQLLPSNDPNRASTPADGVRVAVQLRGTELWSQTIGPDDYSTHQPTGLTGLTVQKGDRIYFRVGSIENGSYDSVNWAPVIDYVGQDATLTDANGKTLYHFDAAKDFVLSSAQTLTPPLNGTVHIGGPFVKPVTTDDVTLMIQQTVSGTTSTIWQQTYAKDQAVNTTTSLDNISVTNTSQYSFVVSSPTNIDWANVSWQPVMKFTSAADPTVDLTQTTIQTAAVPNYTVLANGLQPALPYSVVLGDASVHSVTVTPQLIPGGGTGMIVFSVKAPGKLLGEVVMPVQNGVVQPGNYALNISVQNGDHLYMEYHVADATLAAAITNASAALSGEFTATVPAAIWSSVPKNGKEEDIIFGTFYRGWGQFAWNGNGAAGTQAINESLLKPSDQIMQKTANLDAGALTQQDGNQLTPSQTYDPKADQFIILVASGNQQRWGGYDPEVFVKGANMSSSRMGAKDVSPLVINTGTGTGSPGIDKVSKVTSTSYTLSASIGVAGASGSFSSSTSKSLTDFMDMNGDKYPDIVGEQLIQYTDARGGLSARTTPNGPIQQTAGTVKGVALTGSPSIPTSIFRKSPQGNQQVDAGNAQTNAGSAKISVTGNAGVNQGSNQSNFLYLDMNGDGLPDRVDQSSHLVSLNLGYGFAPGENWGLDQIQQGGSNAFSGGAGLGYNFGQNSISVGVSLSRSDNATNLSLQDMNGDGLPDLVTVAQGGGGAPVLQVRLNTGNGFSTDMLTWTGASAIGTNSSASESANLAFTVGFTIFGVKFTVNPSANVGFGMARDLTRIQDINGDGYPDFVSSTKDDNLTAALSTIGRTNLLQSVSRPMGAAFTLDYQRAGNTYAMPNSVWTLTSVKLFDGFRGDGPDTLLTTFDYAGGHFDRDEREFDGFATVHMYAHDAAHNNAVYSVATEIFSNDNFYTKGMLLSTLTEDGNGKKYTETDNTYQLRDIASGTVLPDSYKSNDAGAAFVALSRTDRLFYEGQPNPGKTTYMTYGYDTKGNITQYTDFGDPGAADDIGAAITYYNVPDKYIVGSPKSILVTGSGVTYRKRESTIDQQTGDVTEMRQYLQNGTVATTDMGYDGYGNLINITGAANSKGQRFRQDYVFDNHVQQYVVKATNSFGYSSQSTFDYRFSQLLSSVDLNNNTVNYQLDDLGRVVRVTGPYELAAGVPYTIMFDYHPGSVVPWAHTTHYDPAHPGNDLETVTFVDGLGRMLQTKKDGAIFQGQGRADKEQLIVSGRIRFDGLGRPVAAYYPVTENKGTDTVFNSNFDNIAPTTTTYDVLDRVLTITLPDGSVTQTAYGFGSDRQQQTQFGTTITDANGKIAEQFTNVRGLVTASKDHTGNGDVWTSFTYDAINEQISAMDDIGATTVSQYDMLGRKVSGSHPDQGLTQFTYDLAGNLIRQVTANLQKDSTAIVYSYDFNRLTDITYPHNTENTVHYTYGAPGAVSNRAGRIVVQEDASGAQEFFYGPMGETLKNVRTVIIPKFGEQTYVTQWTYDTWNRLTSMIYPDSEVITYSYNLGGGLLSMAGNRSGQVTSYVQQLGYDKFESRLYLGYGNGTQTNYSYEPDRRRLQNMVVTNGNGNGRRIMDNVYAYDKVSNILSLTNNAPIPSSNLMGGSAQYSYTYDDLYRLTTASGLFKGSNEQDRYSLSMEYNSVGGITRKTQTSDKSPNGNKWIAQKKMSYDNSYTYDPKQPHAATHIGRQTYTYDPDGNQTGCTDDKTGQRQKKVWDEENRLRSVSVNGQLNSYVYDALGDRVLKGLGSGQSVFVDGAVSGSSGGVGNFTVYVNPYLVVKSGEYSNHYFIESQRIATRLEHGWDQQVSAPDAGDSVPYTKKGKQLMLGLNRDQQALQGDSAAASGITGVDARAPDAGNGNSGNGNSANGNSSNGNSANPGNNGNHYAYGHDKKNGSGSGGSTGSGSGSADFLYFYHPDHLGSTSYVTDGSGEVYEHLEYFAFGETFVEEHSNTDRIPYLFSGKQLDNETGLYYFGLRYYDPRTSIWQSVDPRPNVAESPYAAMRNNPITMTDPNGDTTIYYNMTTGAVMGQVNNKGAIQRVKVDELALANVLPSLSGLDLSKQSDANTFVTTLNNTLSSGDKATGNHTISFGTGELNMDFTGHANANRSAQADGSLNVNAMFDDGSSVRIASYQAVGGPYGNGAPENGLYKANNVQDRGPASARPNVGMTRDGVGFSMDLNPQFPTGRTLERIHPDGNTPGTKGCIGLQVDAGRLTEFRNTMSSYLRTHRSIKVNVNIRGNPNNNGLGANAHTSNAVE
ncbi:SpvB/TcaC N-terminal domain-containing protein [Puia sp.]|uniref:SpvB/TcaC N-terminal domain-containing protein n=1 Tax=Puia sp. TaxID=2045100 RepID=UPI002F429DDC